MSLTLLLDRGVLLLAPAALLGAAAVTDLRSRRIPNWVNAAIAISAWVYASSRGGAAGTFEAVAGMAAGLALMLIPFSMGWMGAGDVKLAAACGGWLGPYLTFWMVMWASVVGGALSALVWLFAPAEERAMVVSNLARLLRAGAGGKAEALRRSGTGRGVPYGVGIAAVAAVLIALRIFGA